MLVRACLFPLIVLLVVAAFAAGAGGASAAPKEVAYVCHGEDICLLDPDNPTAGSYNLTDDGTTSYDEDPTWSPDGKRLAFVAKFTSPPSENIYTMEPEASGQGVNNAVQITHFTNGEVPTEELAWSPDGTKIAFVRGATSFGSNPLWAVNSDGSSANATEIPTTGGGATPTFSADSGKIAFWHNNQIYTVNADLSAPAAALPGATCQEPAWSPDGSKIACGREFQSTLIFGAAGGSPLTTIASDSQFTFASWSPSGAQLAYHETTGENSYFHVVNADGSGNHALPIVQDLNANGPAASWSPDGTRLVFQGRYFGPPAESNEVYIANANGTGSVTPLTTDQGHDTEPAWRPNHVTNPGPQVLTPSGGSNAPLAGPTVKPKISWFTNRIPWTWAPYVPMLSVGCGGSSCNVSGQGKAKGAVAAGVLSQPRPAPAAVLLRKPITRKKPKLIVVAGGKVHVPANQTRTLKLKLTRTAIKILEKARKLEMIVTVTTTIPGQGPLKASRVIEIFVKPGTSRKHP